MVCVYVSVDGLLINMMSDDVYLQYVGGILGIVYGMDAFVAYKDYKSFKH